MQRKQPCTKSAGNTQCKEAATDQQGVIFSLQYGSTIAVRLLELPTGKDSFNSAGRHGRRLKDLLGTEEPSTTQTGQSMRLPVKQVQRSCACAVPYRARASRDCDVAVKAGPEVYLS